MTINSAVKRYVSKGTSSDKMYSLPLLEKEIRLKLPSVELIFNGNNFSELLKMSGVSSFDIQNINFFNKLHNDFYDKTIESVAINFFSHKNEILNRQNKEKLQLIRDTLNTFDEECKCETDDDKEEKIKEFAYLKETHPSLSEEQLNSIFSSLALLEEITENEKMNTTFSKENNKFIFSKEKIVMNDVIDITVSKEITESIYAETKKLVETESGKIINDLIPVFKDLFHKRLEFLVTMKKVKENGINVLTDEEQYDLLNYSVTRYFNILLNNSFPWE